MSQKSKSKAAAKRARSNKVKFRAGSRIGYADADEDADFLNHCYIDVGYVNQALNTEDPGSILLGRTGSGKTAAINHIELVEENVIRLNPEDLSLNYISNSDVLSFFHGLGVDLDLFFQLLWRHVLCVELLNFHYTKKKKDTASALIFLKDLIGGNRSKRLALEYLEKWGSNFWEETQRRIKDIVEKFENELKAGVDLSNLGVPLNAQGSSKISSELKTELAYQARKVVNEVQIKKLSNLMDVMAEDIFEDRQQKYYVVVDRLDEKWVDDSLRYRLLRALIETIKSFRKIRNVKLIIALRVDLLERIYRYTRSSGFQEEKYEDFNIPISWRKEKLFELVDRRISDMYMRQYTRDEVGFSDVFPRMYRQERSCFDYLVVRTQFRPRDIIAFVNQILVEVRGKTEINSNDIDKAEIEYSKKRLQALCTEWQDEHPNLEQNVEILRNLPIKFEVGNLSREMLEEGVLSVADKEESPDELPQIARAYMYGDGKTSIEEFRNRVLLVLYKVGIVGVKPNGYEGTYFSFNNSFVFRVEDIRSGVSFFVSPMLWHALGSKKIRGKGDLTDDLL